jgi:hypothetical protein
MPQKRFNIALSAKLEEFFRKRAEVSGQSMASVIGLALGEYYQERKMLEKAKPELDKIQAQFELLKEIVKDANSNNNNNTLAQLAEQFNSNQ